MSFIENFASQVGLFLGGALGGLAYMSDLDVVDFLWEFPTENTLNYINKMDKDSSSQSEGSTSSSSGASSTASSSLSFFDDSLSNTFPDLADLSSEQFKGYQLISEKTITEKFNKSKPLTQLEIYYWVSEGQPLEELGGDSLVSKLMQRFDHVNDRSVFLAHLVIILERDRPTPDIPNGIIAGTLQQDPDWWRLHWSGYSNNNITTGTPVAARGIEQVGSSSAFTRRIIASAANIVDVATPSSTPSSTPSTAVVVRGWVPTVEDPKGKGRDNL